MFKNLLNPFRLQFMHNRATHSNVVRIVFLIFALHQPQIGVSGESAAYFKSPQQAVDLIKTMLLSKSWNKLSCYYDLSGTDINRETLISGDFFIRKKRPEVTHPAGFWKYKQPFSPQFSYLSDHNISDEIVEVTVHVEIDQGDGMIQRGMDSFKLRKSSSGYQLLPKSLHAPEAPDDSEKPISAQSTSETMPDLKK